MQLIHDKFNLKLQIQGEYVMNKTISAILGALISIMIMFNGTLANGFGKYTSNIIIHITGLVAVILILLLKKSKFKGLKCIPWYFYSAGAIGVFSVLFNTLSFQAIGVSLTLALGLLGQSVSSIIIDHYGLMGMNIVKFEKKKLVGLFIIVTGIVIMTIY
jgi:transporter family-2 protein